MSLIRKRKLTKNQTRRIESNAAFTGDDSTLAKGVIVAHFGKQLDVQISDKGQTALTIGDIYRCHARTNLPMLTAGDWVQISFDAVGGLGRIETLLPRHTLITRPDRYHKLKPVAANADLLVIVFADLPKPATGLIDRYLLIAHLSGIKPLLVLNKTDLPVSADTLGIFEEYHALGYDCIKTSSHKKDGLDVLQNRLSGKLAIFAGQSGVGKSSLINALLPNAGLDTNVLSTQSQLGQHTTTTSRLIAYDPKAMDKGGVIDTPGIREYGIWHLQKKDILGGFSELAPLADLCRFRDCNHAPNAKGCALWQAVASGTVLARRVESLTRLQEETQG